ncbi:glycosyltransferase [Candidatus Nomurabacteria bacterium]|nr:glycosyltransferase [Candidatus Nomurabacteria bacterium]
MGHSKNDQIKYLPGSIKHESAGGFVFFEDPTTHELFVALLKKNDGNYVIPKGHLKIGESPKVAAIREIREELLLREPLEIIAFLGIDNYTFTLTGNKNIHDKDVHLYVLRVNQKAKIKPQKEENFDTAEWLSFDTAIKKISFDKENLLKARQVFYYHKPVRIYKNLLEISSITIAVPTHNGAETIKNTLYSILERLKEIPDSIDKEIIVCADHCTDDTILIIKNFINGQAFKEIIIKLIDNDGCKGKATVLNKIFQNSSKEIFCTIDDDVILEKKCLVLLLEAFVATPNLRCVFSEWKRLSFKSKNPWKLFWYHVLGVKYDIQPYEKPRELVRGSCMLLRKESFVYLPPVLNEDQFLQYIYYPQTKEIKNSIIYFHSVSSIHDYCKRSLRIMFGSKQLLAYFTKERIEEYSKLFISGIDYKRIMTLPLKQKMPFLFYRCVRFLLNIYKKTKLYFIKKYEWFRIKKN